MTSAGNNGVNADKSPHYPSDYSDETNENYTDFSDRVISVGGITKIGYRAAKSNYGTRAISLYAPGQEISTPFPYSLNSSGYALYEGTSVAAPHVAGPPHYCCLTMQT